MQRGQPEIVERRDRGGERLQRSRRLPGRDHPGRHRERGIVAQRRPVEQRLPHRLLARRQFRRVIGAIADKIGAGVVRGLGDDLLALHRGAVDRGRGKPGQRHRRRTDLVPLRVPFGGDRCGQLFARHDQLVAAGGAHRPAVERDAPAALGGTDRSLFVHALHAISSSSANGSPAIGGEPEEFPEAAHMRRQRGGHPQRSAVGVRDFEAARVQVQAMRRRAPGELRRGAAILAVAEDRRAERGAMGAQLMRAPGDRQQRDPARPAAGMVDHAVIGDGALAASRRHARARARLALAPPPLESAEIDAAPLRPRQAGDDRPIDFPGRLLAEGPGEKRRGRRVTRDQQHARGVLVEPVHEARPFGRLRSAARRAAHRHGARCWCRPAPRDRPAC